MDKIILQRDMLDYKRGEYISNFTYKRSILNKEIKKAKRKRHSDFVKKNRKTLIILDTLFVLIILFNLGALLITNALVVKAEPTLELMEVNPIAAEQYGLEFHPEAKTEFIGFVFYMYIWSFLSISYIIFRRYIYKDKHLSILIGFIVLYGIGIGTDFINDLGYYIGKLIYT